MLLDMLVSDRRRHLPRDHLKVEFPIGAGSLPLMRGSALLPDDSHFILLSPNANAVSLGMDDSSKDDGNDIP